MTLLYRTARAPRSYVSSNARPGSHTFCRAADAPVAIGHALTPEPNALPPDPSPKGRGGAPHAHSRAGVASRLPARSPRRCTLPAVRLQPEDAHAAGVPRVQARPHAHRRPVGRPAAAAGGGWLLVALVPGFFCGPPHMRRACSPSRPRRSTSRTALWSGHLWAACSSAGAAASSRSSSA
jgi:hypothetical protein